MSFICSKLSITLIRTKQRPQKKCLRLQLGLCDIASRSLRNAIVQTFKVQDSKQRQTECLLLGVQPSLQIRNRRTASHKNSRFLIFVLLICLCSCSFWPHGTRKRIFYWSDINKLRFKVIGKKKITHLPTLSFTLIDFSTKRNLFVATLSSYVDQHFASI